MREPRQSRRETLKLVGVIPRSCASEYVVGEETAPAIVSPE